MKDVSPEQKELIEKRLQLPDPLKPPPRDKMRLGFRNGIHATADVVPLDSVPAGLRTFRVGRHLQPPMLCYGWPVNVPELVNLAESKGFLGETTTREDVSPIGRIDVYDTQHLLQHVVRDDLGITSITPEIKFIYPKGNGREALICLWTTWNDPSDDPPPNDVQKIATFLGLEEQSPKWYISFEEGKWAFRTFRKFPVPREIIRYGVIRYEGINDNGCQRCKVRPLP
ncbi:hypothetical protein CVT26_012533 [Gymnopilus dilepis]|uniref:Uncharacterized protein n=1 Tax=Gymnopilus dilepis TaxID=231916 RepID=A0A409WAK4_9AGAR|nr:hypothetical protein CVT26_012533 [Gymnopilus dilepis]